MFPRVLKENIFFIGYFLRENSSGGSDGGGGDDGDDGDDGISDGGSGSGSDGGGGGDGVSVGGDSRSLSLRVSVGQVGGR